MRTFFLLVVSIVMMNSLRAQQIESNTKWLYQTDTEYHFSFSYPENWQLKLPGTNTRFFVTSPKETEEDPFRENINCIARVIEQKGVTVKDAEGAIKTSLEKLQDFELIRSEYITWNKSETLEIEYTCTQKHEDKTFHIKMFQRVAIVDGTLFTLTYTSEFRGYDRYIGTVKKIMDSLKVR